MATLQSLAIVDDNSFYVGGTVSAETRRGLLARLDQPLPEAQLDRFFAGV